LVRPVWQPSGSCAPLLEQRSKQVAADANAAEKPIRTAPSARLILPRARNREIAATVAARGRQTAAASRVDRHRFDQRDQSGVEEKDGKH
jgi:hypothetical protein